TTPFNDGPRLLSSASAVWQTEHRLKSFSPAAASAPSPEAAVETMRAVEKARGTRRSDKRMDDTPDNRPCFSSSSTLVEVKSKSCLPPHFLSTARRKIRGSA